MGCFRLIDLDSRFEKLQFAFFAIGSARYP